MAVRARATRISARPIFTRRRVWEVSHPHPEPIAALYRAVRAALPKRYAVIGAYAFAALVEPRETQDLDLLMSRRSARALARKLVASTPGLRAREEQNVIRLALDESFVLDLVVSEPEPLRGEVLRSRLVERQVPRFGRALVPPPEGLIALKFAAITSSTRRPEKRMYDIGDLLSIARKHRLERPELARLAELIYTGASKDLAKVLDDFAAGRPIVI